MLAREIAEERVDTAITPLSLILSRKPEPHGIIFHIYNFAVYQKEQQKKKPLIWTHRPHP